MNKGLKAGLLTTLLGGTALPALAQGTPSGAWTSPALATAKYVILDPRIEGNPNIVNAEQRAGILAAMKRDSAGAIRRRYPGATVMTGGQAAGAIRVTPVLVTPDALVPWAKLTARLDFDLASGQRVTLGDQFGLLTLWQHQADAATYLYGELVKQLP
ncbi:hypothetical protein DEIPH_ctg025orf0248 [Deinococcus phoenicis]|uniref:Uncharacterized protein n=1 Tax=Deinococcus phoenicis TaxID=1476583 RepID=A0A016QQE1_9DEIO|nr:hypothetical protein [Deinococcus phoenicis]EYB68365.1 hypothetical protein DEIPH_ctg025orf0248 [Deinococcus phoenicis]